MKQKYMNFGNYSYKEIRSNPRDRLEIEIGDSKQPEFYPQLKIMRWDNEVNASFRLVDTEPKTLTTEDEKIKLIGQKKEVHLYELPVSDELKEGGFEFEVILKEKPVSNKIEFTLETKGLDFFYQPPLNQEELPPDGVSATETDVFDKDGKSITHRPKNIVGSYAVYHSGNPINYVGGKEYKCGKVGHIYRPKIIDSVGKEVWGILNIQEGILSVTIPQEFLNTATYPIRHAAGFTMGFLTAGGSRRGYGDYIWGSVFSSNADEAGDAVSITAWLSRYSTTSVTARMKCGLYLLTDYEKKGQTEEREITLDHADAQEYTFNFSAPKPDVVGSTEYVICIWGDYINGQKRIWYDSATSQSRYESYNYDTHNAVYPDPLEPTTSSHKFSIYCTYTAGGTGPTGVKTINDTAIASVKTINDTAIASVKTIMDAS